MLQACVCQDIEHLGSLESTQEDEVALGITLMPLSCSPQFLHTHYLDNNFSMYTLSDLGDLSNTIGLLSRTIQQYSPPSEWIMCELGVFPIFFLE